MKCILILFLFLRIINASISMNDTLNEFFFVFYLYHLDLTSIISYGPMPQKDSYEFVSPSDLLPETELTLFESFGQTQPIYKLTVEVIIKLLVNLRRAKVERHMPTV